MCALVCINWIKSKDFKWTILLWKILEKLSSSSSRKKDFLRSYTSDSNTKKNLRKLCARERESEWRKKGSKEQEKELHLNISQHIQKLTEFTPKWERAEFPIFVEVRKISPALKYRLHTLRTCFQRTCDHSNSNGDDSGFFLLSLSRTFTLSFRHSRAVCHKDRKKDKEEKNNFF